MKKKLQILSLLIISATVLNAQYQVGQKTITYTDPDRSNRAIETVVFYPSTTGGADAAIASGQFPVIVFGHGFSMADKTLYQYLWDGIVTEGYICLFPLTEGGGMFSPPSHEQFGLDLKFLNLQIKAEGANSSSFFYQKIADKTAIMGHSMGGKATYIASANNSDITTVISLTAALGDPPIGTGYNAMGLSVPFVVVPTLVIDAEFDCVVPAAEGHQIIYDNLTTDCRTYVKILGGGHCYMASGSSVCEQGEGWIGGNCASDFTITRGEQNAIVLGIVLPYLEFMLKDVAIAEDEFLAYITESTEVTYLRDCEMPDPQIEDVDIYNAVENISVAYGTLQNIAISQLAQTITISDTDGGTHSVALNWSVAGYNANVPAVYVATGTFILPAGVVQSTPPTTLNVTATITVQEFVSAPQFTNESEIALYPNPANNMLYYEIANVNDTEVLTIYNLYGAVVLQKSITSKGSIDINDLSSGIYIVNFREKFIKLSVDR